MKNLILKLIATTILLLSVTTNIYSTELYKMTIENIEVLSDTSIEASVYIQNTGDELMITSYQCALSINQEIDLESLLLYYVEGSSELINEPNLFVGAANIDGPTELTFVSYIGNDIISTKTLVGKFVLQGKIDPTNLNLLNIQWDFEGTINTIITGKDFVNITNPESHESIFTSLEDEEKTYQKLNILDVTVSSSPNDETYPERVLDGRCFCDGEENSARWAHEGMPSSLLFDLGQNMQVSKTKFSFYKFNEGRIYQYSVRVSSDNVNWTEVLTNVDSKSEEWSEEEFASIDARYVELVVLGTKGENTTSWVSIWEAEIFGESSTTSVEDDETIAIETNLPTDYGLSQNYPNPFNPSTKVEVRMKESGNAKLAVYNLLGERVLAVLDQDLSAGVHEISIDGSSLASGIYIYKLDVGNRFSQVKKMNLIK